MLTFLFEIERARCNYTTFFRYRETFTYYVLFRTTHFSQSFAADSKWQRSGQKQQTKKSTTKYSSISFCAILLNAISSANYSKVRTQKPNLSIPVFSLFHCSAHLHILPLFRGIFPRTPTKQMLVKSNDAINSRSCRKGHDSCSGSRERSQETKKDRRAYRSRFWTANFDLLYLKTSISSERKWKIVRRGSFR